MSSRRAAATIIVEEEEKHAHKKMKKSKKHHHHQRSSNDAQRISPPPSALLPPPVFDKRSETDFAIVCRSEFPYSKITPFYAIRVSSIIKKERGGGSTLTKYEEFYRKNLENIPLALTQSKFPQGIAVESARDMLKFNEYIAVKDKDELFYTLGKRYNTLPTLAQVVLYYYEQPRIGEKRKAREDDDEDYLQETTTKLFEAFRGEFEALRETRQKEYKHAFEFIHKQTHQLNVLHRRDKRYWQKLDASIPESRILQNLFCLTTGPQREEAVVAQQREEQTRRRGEEQPKEEPKEDNSGHFSLM